MFLLSRTIYDMSILRTYSWILIWLLCCQLKHNLPVLHCDRFWTILLKNHGAFLLTNLWNIIQFSLHINYNAIKNVFKFALLFLHNTSEEIASAQFWLQQATSRIQPVLTSCVFLGLAKICMNQIRSTQVNSNQKRIP